MVIYPRFDLFSVESYFPARRVMIREIVLITNVDARYTCAMRYMRELNEGNKSDRIKAENAYKRFGEIIDGLELIEDKRLTDEAKIRHIIDLLDGYADKATKLIDENCRRHLERLKLQRDQRRLEFETEQAKYDKEIHELEMKLGDKSIPNTVVTEMSLIQ